VCNYQKPTKSMLVYKYRSGTENDIKALDNNQYCNILLLL
jgi:hypothetical protein